MQKFSLIQNIKSYLFASTVFLLACGLMVITHFFNGIEQHWSMILLGCLILLQAIVIYQIAEREKSISSFSEQLLVTKERLTNEMKHRLWAEKTVSEGKIKSLYIDENFPVMLAYFNAELRCRYHNRIFRRWFGLRSDQIDGKLLTEFSNEGFFLDIRNCAKEIFTGKTIHYERTLKSTKGFPYIFTEQFVPHLDSKGKVVGFYTIHTPFAQEKSRISLKKGEQTAHKTEPDRVSQVTVNDTQKKQSPVLRPASDTTIATRVAQAIKEGEFNLFFQDIKSIKASDVLPMHHEILIRMGEEENSQMPPGSFLPFVEQFKLMPQLDRWVVNHIIKWLSNSAAANHVFCLNIAKDTFNDGSFPGFVQIQLQKMNVPASSLCFEIEAIDVQDQKPQVIAFTKKVSQIGCLITLCSFTQDSDLVKLLGDMKVNYIKIDGSLVCNILRDEEDFKEVLAINKLAHERGIKTIAELVETDDIVAKLNEIGVDYMQGFGVAKVQPFEELNPL
ncbi:PAS domain S-box-containing protein [Nitrosomonas sp. PY1]|uniref:sensor domain-containing phosphodiesterase n=1 Tax=Nitrosomonas sp. PY1 TaxID=1803906 RepID=UPI001FC82913|nr:EAL domain-containing protein [Nitrosomonas sp. PY1]GKS68217.1 PAS domain S-box-containing protein [Nitrosomonas sp. PY1]